MERLLFVLQRVSAMLLAVLVFVHLVVIFQASAGGLTGAEILARTQSTAFWFYFYGLFVIAAAIHAPIGVRNILAEWTPLPGRIIDVVMILFAILLGYIGMTAVFAVSAP